MNKLISIKNLNKDKILKILKLARAMETNSIQFSENLKNKSLAIAFFESSTRTRIGFSLAMKKLGGDVVEISEVKYKKEISSSESIEDTLKVIGDYTDILALRHPSKNLVKQLKLNSPIINCGNGGDEHPTQALIDLYYIWKHFKKIDGLSVAIVGDLKNMRTAHSLALILSYFDTKVHLISPNSLRMKGKNNLNFTEKEKFDINNDDVIYMAGFPPNKEISNTERLKFQMNIQKAALSGKT